VLVVAGEIRDHLALGDDRAHRTEAFARELGTLHSFVLPAEPAEGGRRVCVRQGGAAHVVRRHEQLARLVEALERPLPVVVVHRVNPRRDQDPALLTR